MKASSVMATLAAIGLSGCGGLYVHDERLLADATVANSNLSTAQTLTPFDDQLAKLATFANEEDLTVARYRTAQRDVQLASILTRRATGPQAGSTAERDQAVVEIAEARLRIIAPSLTQADFETISAGLATRNDSLRQVAANERLASSARQSWVQAAPEDTRPTDCPTLIVTVSRDQAVAFASGPAPLQFYGEIAKSCLDADVFRQSLKSTDEALRRAGGELAQVALSQIEARAASTVDLSRVDARLSVEIKNAETESESNDTTKLTDFVARVTQILRGVGHASSLAGWDRVDRGIDAILKSQACVPVRAGTTIEGGLTAEDCTPEPETSQGRADAAWAFATAVAQMADANSENYRSTQWLLAAKAIIAAQKADAQLRADQATRLASSEQRRLEATFSEVQFLRTALAAAQGQPTVCTGGSACAYAALADSWNYARIPATVLRYRTVQLDREYAVRRARAVADEQRALALAGTATLEGYARGGITRATIAELAWTLTLIGVTGGQ